MKKIYTLFFVLAISAFLSGQTMMHKNWWYMGLTAGCTFNTGAPVAVTNGMVNVNEGSIAMSDKTTGALLFYTDGMTIWNSTHAVMTNGTGLMGNPSSTQSGMVVPRPGSTTQFYVFTVWPGSGLRYSIVDMSLSAGLGAVTATKNVLLGATTINEKLTGCLHFNMIDYWVTVHGSGTNAFITYPVTNAGVGAPVTSNVGPVSASDIGYMNFSSCGDRIGLSNYNPSMGVCSFNNATGVISNYIDLNFGTNYSSGFSPDGTKFYHWSYSPTNAVYEVDLNMITQVAINASRVLIATETNWFGAFVFGRNGKLYTPSYGTTNMHVINNPNLMGAAAGYSSNAVPLAGKVSQLGLPNFIEISACPLVLPVELKYFTGTCKNEKPYIQWATATESRNDHFEVERSSDGINFEFIARVEKSTAITAEKKYSVSDETPIRGIAYYRLKQVDKDGSIKYFESIAVSCSEKKPIKIYPNPSSGIFTINGLQGENEVTITDVLGRIVYHETNLIDITEINLQSLNNGIYYLNLSIKDQESTTTKLTLFK